MPAITIPNLGQPGAPGVPLSVQSAPTGQPTLTPPAAITPPAPDTSTTPSGPSSNINPLYQQFLDSAAQAGQLANNWQTQQPSQSGSQTATPGKVGLFGSGLASLVASAKA